MSPPEAEGDLYQLAYISRSLLRADVVKEEIRRILESARRKNGESGVTGALLFTRGFFAQVLEGPTEAVETIFETIQMDPRHREVRVVFNRPVLDRAFAAWTMAFAGNVDADDVASLVSEVFNRPEDIEAGDAGRSIVQLLRELIQKNEAMQGS